MPTLRFGCNCLRIDLLLRRVWRLSAANLSGGFSGFFGICRTSGKKAEKARSPPPLGVCRNDWTGYGCMAIVPDRHGSGVGPLPARLWQDAGSH